MMSIYFAVHSLSNVQTKRVCISHSGTHNVSTFKVVLSNINKINIKAIYIVLLLSAITPPPQNIFYAWICSLWHTCTGGTCMYSYTCTCTYSLLRHREMEILHRTRPSFKRSLSPLQAIWLATLPQQGSHMTWPTTWRNQMLHPLPTLAVVSSSRRPVCTSVDRLGRPRPFFSTWLCLLSPRS